MASIKRIGEQRYFVRVSQKTGGKRTFINKVIKGKLADAKTYAQKIETALSTGTPIEAATMTASEFFEKWFEHVKPNLAANTFAFYQGTIQRYATPVLGSVLLGDVTPFAIQEIYNKLAKADKIRTAHSLHSALSKAFNQAIKWGMLRDNPTKRADKPKAKYKEKKVFTLEQLQLFLKFAADDPHFLLFQFAIQTGMRPAEYLALRWSDVDLDKQTAAVNQTVQFNRTGGGYYFKDPKTPKSRRLIPLSANTVNSLREHKRKQNAFILKSGANYFRLDLVFPNQCGNPQNPINLFQRHFQLILGQCGLKDEGFTLYSLRHACATLLLLAGENPKIVSERLGHSNINLTLQVYSHVLPNMQAAATEKLDRLFSQK